MTDTPPPLRRPDALDKAMHTLLCDWEIDTCEHGLVGPTTPTLVELDAFRADIAALHARIAALTEQLDGCHGLHALARDRIAGLEAALAEVLREYDYWTYPWSKGVGRDHKFAAVQDTEYRAMEAARALLAPEPAP